MAAQNGIASHQSQAVKSGILAGDAEADLTQSAYAHTACLVYGLHLCGRVGENKARRPGLQAIGSLLTSSHNKIPARRTICHHKEWSEFIPIICHGWAASSLTLPDGRRQILSFLLPGDVVSSACLLEPMSGRTVEAITEVTYRKFKRSELKSILFKYPDLLEKVTTAWIEERAQADELALDLGRRTADERIARLILNLAEKLAKCGTIIGQAMEFPLRQRHIADATGLTPVHVSKVLGEFQRAGMIKIRSRSLTIANATELRRTADWR
jgi:CRP/FNR family transcriptional regulator, anaerobic regulatory protein